MKATFVITTERDGEIKVTRDGELVWSSATLPEEDPSPEDPLGQFLEPWIRRLALYETDLVATTIRAAVVAWTSHRSREIIRRLRHYQDSCPPAWRHEGDLAWNEALALAVEAINKSDPVDPE